MRPSFPRSYRGSPLLIFLAMLLISGQLFANTLFGPPRDIPISGSYSSLIALGDLNNDGNLDIVVGSAFGASDGNGVFTVLLANGDGTFKSPAEYETGYAPTAFALADVNGDGKLDVVALNSCRFPLPGCPPSGTMQVFLGNGDGTFQPPIYSGGGAAFSVAVADFDGDGRSDLAATFETGCGYGGFSPCDYGLIFKGNGDGTFGGGSGFFLTGNGSDLVVAADFNGDGKTDLALIESQHGNVDILLGNGDGTFLNGIFLPWSSFHTGRGRSLTAADINGDGHLDLAVTTDAVLRIAYGNGDGTFQTPIGLNTTTDPDPKQVIAADFDGDGRLDLAVALGSNSMLAVYINKPSGTFQKHLFAASPGPVGLAAGDLNHDGYLDIVALNDTNNVGFTYHSVSVFLNQSATTLSPDHLTFSTQVVGTTSAAKIVTLKNSGTKNLTISRIAITGTNAGSFAQTHTCGSSLAAGASCTISVRFSPKGSGTRIAALTVSDSGVGSPQTVALSGIGTTAKLSPTSLSFGTVEVGTASAAKTVTLTNVGTTTLSIIGIAITGTNAGDFAQTHTCGSSLAAGGSCAINVKFKPTASGTRTAALSVSDSAAGSPQKVALYGVGAAPTVSSLGVY